GRPLGEPVRPRGLREPRGADDAGARRETTGRGDVGWGEQRPRRHGGGGARNRGGHLSARPGAAVQPATRRRNPGAGVVTRDRGRLARASRRRSGAARPRTRANAAPLASGEPSTPDPLVRATSNEA